MKPYYLGTPCISLMDAPLAFLGACFIFLSSLSFKTSGWENLNVRNFLSDVKNNQFTLIKSSLVKTRYNRTKNYQNLRCGLFSSWGFGSWDRWGCRGTPTNPQRFQFQIGMIFVIFSDKRIFEGYETLKINIDLTSICLVLFE